MQENKDTLEWDENTVRQTIISLINIPTVVADFACSICTRVCAVAVMEELNCEYQGKLVLHDNILVKSQSYQLPRPIVVLPCLAQASSPMLWNKEQDQ